MDNSLQQKWNARYADRNIGDAHAADVLKLHQHYLPVTGKALDIACGCGGNSLLLAAKGLSVDAWDISNQVIEKITSYSAEQHLHIKASVVDIMNWYPESAIYDVIVVSYFLERAVVPEIIRALKPGGVLYYQTYCGEYNGFGPSNPAYRLDCGELLRLFRRLNVKYYAEDAKPISGSKCTSGQAMIVALKRFQ